MLRFFGLLGLFTLFSPVMAVEKLCLNDIDSLGGGIAELDKVGQFLNTSQNGEIGLDASQIDTLCYLARTPSPRNEEYRYRYFSWETYLARTFKWDLNDEATIGKLHDYIFTHYQQIHCEFEHPIYEAGGILKRMVLGMEHQSFVHFMKRYKPDFTTLNDQTDENIQQFLDRLVTKGEINGIQSVTPQAKQMFERLKGFVDRAINEGY
jgi:hypothetical protein